MLNLRPKDYRNNAETCRDGAQHARTLSHPALYALEVNATPGERAKAWHGSPRSRIAGNCCWRLWGSSQTFAGLRCHRAGSRAHLGVFARMYGVAYSSQCLRASQGSVAEVADVCVQEAKTAGGDFWGASTDEWEYVNADVHLDPDGDMLPFSRAMELKAGRVMRKSSRPRPSRGSRPDSPSPSGGNFCHYCGNPGCQLRNCPFVEEDIRAGRCVRNQDGRVVLPNGNFVPRQIPGFDGITMRDRIYEWHCWNPNSLAPPTANQMVLSITTEEPRYVTASSYTLSTEDWIEQLKRELFALQQARRTRFDGVHVPPRCPQRSRTSSPPDREHGRSCEPRKERELPLHLPNPAPARQHEPTAPRARPVNHAKHRLDLCLSYQRVLSRIRPSVSRESSSASPDVKLRERYRARLPLEHLRLCNLKSLVNQLSTLSQRLAMRRTRLHRNFGQPMPRPKSGDRKPAYHYGVTVDASNPPLKERENQAESLLKVEAGGRANADKGRGGEEMRKARANAFALGTLRSGGQCRARQARQGLARLSALPGSRKPLLEVVGAFADLRRSSLSSRAHLGGFARVYGVAYAGQSLRASQGVRECRRGRGRPSMRSRAITRRDKSASAGLRECRNVLRISLLAMQSTLENLDCRSVEVRNEVAALARAQVLQQLAVLEGLVDTNSRSCEEWLEAQNELDYRMHAYLVLTYDTRECELLSIATRIEMVLRCQTLDETFLVIERYHLFHTQREVSEAMYLAARERLRLLHDHAHAAVCIFSSARPCYVTVLARAEDLRSTVTSLEREVKRELASLAVGLEEAFREHEEQFPGFEQPQQMEEGEVRRDLEEAAEEMEAEGDAP
ncbi:LOW QUALITY PROTEIN: hypothetical protein ACG7TL_001769 [Trametes sanguinea]